MFASNNHSMDSITSQVQGLTIGNSRPQKGPRFDIVSGIDAVCSSEPPSDTQTNTIVVKTTQDANSRFPLSLLIDLIPLQVRSASMQQPLGPNATRHSSEMGEKTLSAVIRFTFHMHCRVELDFQQVTHDLPDFPDPYHGRPEDSTAAVGLLADEPAWNARVLLHAMGGQPFTDIGGGGIIQWAKLRLRQDLRDALGTQGWAAAEAEVEASMRSLDEQMMVDTLSGLFPRLRQAYVDLVNDMYKDDFGALSLDPDCMVLCERDQDRS